MTKEEYEAYEEQCRIDRFWNGLKHRRERDQLHDSTYLRYTFSDDDGGNKKVADVCKKFVGRWPEMQKESIGLLLYGPVGSGKSFFGSCVCNAVTEQFVSSCATSLTRILNQLQTARDKQEVLDSLVQYKFLLVDDFGTSRQTEYAQEQIFGVIDAIYRAKIPVVITSNLSLKDLEHPASLSDTRLFDRILSMCPVRVCVDGPSRRKAEADRKTKLARELLL